MCTRRQTDDLVRHGLVATSYDYGLTVIVIGLVATINLIRVRNHNTQFTKEVTQ